MTSHEFPEVTVITKEKKANEKTLIKLMNYSKTT